VNAEGIGYAVYRAALAALPLAMNQHASLEPRHKRSRCCESEWLQRRVQLLEQLRVLDPSAGSRSVVARTPRMERLEERRQTHLHRALSQQLRHGGVDKHVGLDLVRAFVGVGDLAPSHPKVHQLLVLVVVVWVALERQLFGFGVARVLGSIGCLVCKVAFNRIEARGPHGNGKNVVNGHDAWSCEEEVAD